MTTPGLSLGLLHYTAPPVVGGVEAILAEHARLFLNAGHGVRLLVGRGGDDGLPAGVDVRLIPEMDSEYPLNTKVAAALDQGEVLPAFAMLRDHLIVRLKEQAAGLDVLFIHNVMTMHFNLPLTAALHAMLDARSLPRTVVWSHDAAWDDPLQRPHVQPGYPWDLLRTPRSDVHHVVISRARQAGLAPMFGLPQQALQVIPNGVQVRFWWNLSPAGDRLIMEHGLLDGDLFILQPARITQLKNIAYSLHVAAAVKAQGLAPRFVVTGPPDPHDAGNLGLLSELRELRHTLGLDGEALFLAELGPDPDVPHTVPFEVVRDLYQACDVIFLPSTAEGFGIPVIEAGLLGRPVFCADIPPFREIGRDSVYRFNLNDPPEAVAARLVRWARRDRGYRLRRRVWRHYAWRAVLRKHLLPLIERVTQ